jgi:two-component sensor histidine kinase
MQQIFGIEMGLKLFWNKLLEDFLHFQTDSLGLQLVISLVDQLDEEVELKRDNGTEFIIRFTVIEKQYE